MKIYLLAPLCSILGFTIYASPPDWWTTRDVIHLDSQGVPFPADDFAVLNQGQLKQLALGAYLELESVLYEGAGDDLTTMVSSFYDIGNQEVVIRPNTDNFAIVNQGQLKAMAKPFYDRLRDRGFFRADYPWTDSPNPPAHYAAANIGQAKALFGFDLRVDTDVDGLPDMWETAQFGSLLELASGDFDGDGVPNQDEYNGGFSPTDGLDGNEDPDSDGLTNAEESRYGTDPHLADTDGDLVKDGDDAVPTDADFKHRRVPESKYAVVLLEGTDEGWTYWKINNEGQAIGGFDNGFYIEEGVVWENGVRTSSGNALPMDINDSGSIIWLHLPQAEELGPTLTLDQDAFAFDQTVFDELPTSTETHWYTMPFSTISPPGTRTPSPIDLNNEGKVVGFSPIRYAHDNQNINRTWITVEGEYRSVGGDENDWDDLFHVVNSQAMADELTSEPGKEYRNLSYSYENEAIQIEFLYNSTAATLWTSASQYTYINKIDANDIQFSKSGGPPHSETGFGVLDIFMNTWGGDDTYSLTLDNQQGMDDSTSTILINNLGWIVQQVSEGGATNRDEFYTEEKPSTNHLYIWRNGGTDDLGDHNPTDINDLGWVSGRTATNVGTIWVFNETWKQKSQLGYYENPVMGTISQPSNVLMINNRGEAICTGGILWRNGMFHYLQHLVDPSWVLGGVIDINDDGVLLADIARCIDDEGMPIGPGELVWRQALLYPYDIVRRKPDTVDEYEVLTSMPVFEISDGVGRDVTYEDVTSLVEVSLPSGLRATDVDALQLVVHISGISLSETLIETGAATQTFTNAGNTCTVTVDPSVTLGASIDTLSFEAICAGLGWSATKVVCLESDASSNLFSAGSQRVNLDLKNGLDAAVDTISIQIQDVHISLDETGASSLVFTNGNGSICASISATASPDELDLSIYGTDVSTPYFARVARDAGGYETFSNWSALSADLPPQDPVDAEFYLRIHGKAADDGIPLSIGSAAANLTIEALSVANTNHSMSPPILLYLGDEPEEGISLGARTLQIDTNDNHVEVNFLEGEDEGGVASVIASTTKPAFVGKALGELVGFHTNDIENILKKKLGFGMVYRHNNATISDFTTDIGHASVFYLLAHGYAQATYTDSSDVFFQGIQVFQFKSGKRVLDYHFEPSDVTAHIGTNEFDLVFLNGCGSANNSRDDMGDQFANAFKAKNYAGWDFPVTLSTATDAAKRFFEKLDGGHSVASAAKGIQAAKGGFMAMGAVAPGPTDLELLKDEPLTIIDRTP